MTDDERDLADTLIEHRCLCANDMNSTELYWIKRFVYRQWVTYEIIQNSHTRIPVDAIWYYPTVDLGIAWEKENNRLEQLIHQESLEARTDAYLDKTLPPLVLC